MLWIICNFQWVEARLVLCERWVSEPHPENVLSRWIPSSRTPTWRWPLMVIRWQPRTLPASSRSAGLSVSERAQSLWSIPFSDLFPSLFLHFSFILVGNYIWCQSDKKEEACDKTWANSIKVAGVAKEGTICTLGGQKAKKWTDIVINKFTFVIAVTLRSFWLLF